MNKKAIQEDPYEITFEEIKPDGEVYCWAEMKRVYYRVGTYPFTKRETEAPIAEWSHYDEKNNIFILDQS